MCWMVEGFGQAAHDFEAEFLPEVDGDFIGADDDVELHGAEAAFAGAIERVGAHGAGDATACGPGRGHVPAVGDVAASALLVGAQVVGAEDFSVFFGDKCFVMRRVPVLKCLLAGEVAREGVGFTGADNGFENFPCGVCVMDGGRTNGNHIDSIDA